MTSQESRCNKGSYETKAIDDRTKNAQMTTKTTNNVEKKDWTRMNINSGAGKSGNTKRTSTNGKKQNLAQATLARDEEQQVASGKRLQPATETASAAANA